MAVVVDYVVDVIAMFHRGVTTVRAMDVLRIVTFADVGNAGGAHVLYYARRRQRIPWNR
jgi:hypothetical protein